MGIAVGSGHLDASDWLPLHGARDLGPSVLLSNADGASAYTGVLRYEGRATWR